LTITTVTRSRNITINYFRLPARYLQRELAGSSASYHDLYFELYFIYYIFIIFAGIDIYRAKYILKLNLNSDDKTLYNWQSTNIQNGKRQININKWYILKKYHFSLLDINDLIGWLWYLYRVIVDMTNIINRGTLQISSILCLAHLT
jgi:hypothetical protein